ncbi:hypothetical protein KAU19_00525, partial [Candidatus Parcubacteria bacterium]|nr:hypothetical protein [Candidatus Parcubacteria bacterium]
QITQIKQIDFKVYPVKYLSLAGGPRPPTATNLLPPILSTALFNGVKIFKRVIPKYIIFHKI